MSDVFIAKDIKTVRLFDVYGVLLTPHQREIAELYFDYDLSLAEIAEQKGVSRQSVSDCLKKVRRQTEEYEEKLGLSALAEREEKTLAAVFAWAERVGREKPEFAAELDELKSIFAKENG